MAGKSGEFCRMNTVCTYTANFKRSEHPNISPSEISFKYEIVADKTMWAVCGRGSGMFYTIIAYLHLLSSSYECATLSAILYSTVHI